MKKVDIQIKQMQDEWKEEDDKKYVKPIIKEHKPDGSKAQELLGGIVQITAPWYKPPSKD